MNKNIVLSSRVNAAGIKTLAIDIGGSRLKAALLDEEGNMITDRVRSDTPSPCPPEALLAALKVLVSQLPQFERISVGFPGVVRKGKVYGAINLGPQYWQGYDLEKALEKEFGKPVKVLNDADMQGLAAIRGKGIEMVITLGTGVGCGLFEDGRLAPHLEIGHIPFRNGETFEEQLSNRALENVGKRRWNRRLQRAIRYWRILTFFDRLYLGGGNAENVNFELDLDVEIVPNELGLIGGIWLWKEH
ncbi:MAG: ROK family protein [Blastocatellia bacterium]|nr:ROK family protein [Blastocatellia bacterium]